jgi:hypothetical protein
MASVSLGLNKGADQSPDKITIGTVAASGNDVVLSIDLTKTLRNVEVILILEAFIRRLEDGRLDLLNRV